MRWNLKKPRTGLNLSYHFHWSSQMLAILLWIAKPVWQRCLPFSKLPFFSKKCQKTVVFVHFFNNPKKNLVKSQKGCSWPLKKGRLIFKVHTQDFLVVSFNEKNNSSWILEVHDVQQLQGGPCGPPVWSMYLDQVVKVVGLSSKFRKKEKPRFI